MRGKQPNFAVVFVLFLLATKVCLAQLDFEKPPIDYGQVESHDPVAVLARQLEAGTTKLQWDDEHGWLPDLLKRLNVPIDSQVLVFSKTSMQLHKISPSAPRAIYFNDDVYVGWCQNGDLVELAATDKEQGAVFYTVEQDQQTPKIVRDRGQCLTCHATHRTQSVPGYLIRSVYPDNNGRPRAGTRTYVSDQSSPFELRWGGWYVTGSHGKLRHLGNVRASDREQPETMDVEAGANLNKLPELVDADNYLDHHSDIVALLVLGHQTQMHNLIARANFETRIAEYYDRGINEALGREPDHVSPTTERRIAAAGEALVRFLLYADEIKLTDHIEGTSTFAKNFSANDPHSVDGRSLRELDLTQWLTKYPCSYLIHSEAFDALPPAVMKYVRQRVREVLTAETLPEGYEQLARRDRLGAVELLKKTKPDFFE